MLGGGFARLMARGRVYLKRFCRHAVARTGGQRAQVVGSLAERISLTRCIALYSLAFYSMRRGYDLSFTMGLHILKLPAPGDLVFNPPLRRFGPLL